MNTNEDEERSVTKKSTKKRGKKDLNQYDEEDFNDETCPDIQQGDDFVDKNFAPSNHIYIHIYLHTHIHTSEICRLLF